MFYFKVPSPNSMCYRSVQLFNQHGPMLAKCACAPLLANISQKREEFLVTHKGATSWGCASGPCHSLLTTTIRVCFDFHPPPPALVQALSGWITSCWTARDTQADCSELPEVTSLAAPPFTEGWLSLAAVSIHNLGASPYPALSAGRTASHA